MRHPLQLILFLLAAASCLGAFPGRAHADGKVFARVAALPTIPDQEALIHFAAGVQTLVIDTRFLPPSPPDGVPAQPDPEAPPFAWVVPIPAAGGTPEVLAATQGLFPTLRAAFLPRVVDRAPPPEVAAALAGFALTLLLALQLKSLIHRWVLLTLPTVLVFGTLLPSLGTARGPSPTPVPADGITLLDRKFVGAFDVAVIAATDPSSNSGALLAAWLTDNGFHAPPVVEPVLSDYASRGWCFVAARLHAPDDPAATRLAPHPLAVRFRTDEPVYPLKLTGVDNGPLRLDLYVFGPQMAAADGFTVERCGPVHTPTPAIPYGSIPDPSPRAAVAVNHEGLLSLAPGAAVATKLSATLTAEQMTRDAVIRWEPPRWTGATWYTPRSIAARAAMAAAVTFLAGVLVLTTLVAFRRHTPAGALRLALVPLLLSGLVAAAAYAAYPSVQGEVVYESRYTLYSWNHRVMDHLRVNAVELDESGTPVTVEALRAAMAEFVAEARADEDRTGRRVIAAGVREEDSPGNYIIRESPEDPATLDYIWFDSAGVAHREWIWSR